MIATSIPHGNATALMGIGILLLIGGCGTPVVKVAAFDQGLLKRAPLPAELLRAVSYGEMTVEPALAWLSEINGSATLTFAALRCADGTSEYAAVVDCDPASDRLALLPLADGRTPLDVLGDPAARADLQNRLARLRLRLGVDEHEGGARMLSLREAIEENRLLSPIPPPQRVYAVAANFPSHLRYDLAMLLSPLQRAALSTCRARVFLKHPVTTEAGDVDSGSGTILGPFDPLTYPADIQLPNPDTDRDSARTATRLDYEVEIGAVIARSLKAADVEQMNDRELMSAVAGYVLVSDSKARNPQVVDKLIDGSAPVERSPYTVGDAELDRALGSWDQTTCRWWSYAASWVDATAIGPFLVAAPSAHEFHARAVVTARSYAAPGVRDAPVPTGRESDVLYLRQCAMVSDDSTYGDALIWDLPAIIRSILAEEDNALHFGGVDVELAPGDVICLGTPGGTVITSRPESILTVLRRLLFWWRARDFHDAFFRPDAELYLRHGDEVFFWGTGLGFQQHVVRCVE